MATHDLPQELYNCFLNIINTSGIEKQLGISRTLVYSYRKPERHSTGVVLHILYKAKKLKFTNESN